MGTLTLLQTFSCVIDWVVTESLFGIAMKLPGSTSCLLFLWLLVELPVLAMSRPTPVSHRKDNLRKLFQQMLRLMSIVQGGLHHFDHSLAFEHNITSLPTLNYRPTDLAAVKANSTLSQLRSGLLLFQLHFDWLLYWDNHSSLVSDKILNMANAIQSISILKEIQTDSPTQSSVHSLPPLTSAWDLHQAAAVIHKRLFIFCNWYIRALRVLISHSNK